jgi:hypothetical protein
MSAVPTGFEIQIDNTGAPDGAAKHRTGAVYAVNYPSDPNPDPAIPPATPGDFVNPQNAPSTCLESNRIEVQGDVITVNLNGVDTARYTKPGPKSRSVLTGGTYLCWASGIFELRVCDRVPKHKNHCAVVFSRGTRG